MRLWQKRQEPAIYSFPVRDEIDREDEHEQEFAKALNGDGSPREKLFHQRLGIGERSRFEKFVGRLAERPWQPADNLLLE